MVRYTDLDVTGISETKITNSNSDKSIPTIPGYHYEFVPTPLASGRVGLFINECYSYKILEKTSNEALQALWLEISFVKKRSIICGVIYRQHNSPERFQQYFDETIERYNASGKCICVLGDFNTRELKQPGRERQRERCKTMDKVTE